MMSAPKITCVYQDCFLCGRRGKKRLHIIEKYGLDVEKVSFASPNGAELCRVAVLQYGIGKMPFFTDGKGKFSTSLADFAPTPARKRKTTRRIAKEVKKAVKEVEPGAEGTEDEIAA